ncbi:MAG: hypothetical protein ABW146_08620 [Candidatus Sedimenticola sp. 6PFRAG7]
MQELIALQNNVADLTRAADDLTQEVVGKMGHIDQQVDRFINDWGINGYTRLEVGPGKEFATIEDAFYSLNGKKLKTHVLIKVADGVHETTGIHLEHQPDAHQIRIEGNVANPPACQIKFIPDADKASHGMVIRGLLGLQLAGFKFVGETSATNWTHRSLRLDHGSRVYCDSGTIHITGGCNAVEVEHSHLNAAQIRFEQIKQWNAFIGSGSKAWIQKSKIIGPGKAVRTQVPAHINPDAPQVIPHGIGVFDGAQGWSSESTITGVWVGVTALRNGYAHCDVTTVDGAEIGFHAQFGGIIWTYWWGATASRPKELRSKASNCLYGYYAAHKGLIWAPGAVAESCARGFRAYASSKVLANHGRAINCTIAFEAWTLSEIEAIDTNAASTGNPTQHSPPGNAVPGNQNAIIRYS